MAKTTNLRLFSATLCGFLITPTSAQAGCTTSLMGKWQQTHVVFGGNRFNDRTQSWEFTANGKVRFVKTKPAIDATGNYSCDGDIIAFKGGIPGRLKILEHDGKTMVWESLDSEGGGVTHLQKVE